VGHPWLRQGSSCRGRQRVRQPLNIREICTNVGTMGDLACQVPIFGGKFDQRLGDMDGMACHKHPRLRKFFQYSGAPEVSECPKILLTPWCIAGVGTQSKTLEEN
ncbi:hypothetical protein HAX54_008886, partial [Datura stramonium]|nr:hypothetical protein [Datura stramonium]